MKIKPKAQVTLTVVVGFEPECRGEGACLGSIHASTVDTAKSKLRELCAGHDIEIVGEPKVEFVTTEVSK